ncbi:sensor histidine kinase [Luteibacter aegosomatissinici]|uniref:sensor histidine kinase n=1 Tax=Luteibacter aegosomatissinici TaxID=2911539 RepID=UPI001FF8E822|nr:ATP-binding protein [Luteibacter aegosomatissinici]UPG92624.1 ATP-binding protein [Luteibacter aegosomatissinici]
MRRSRVDAAGLVVALPAILALGGVLVVGVPAPAEAVALLILVVALTLVAGHVAGERPNRLRTVANLLEALREGDYGVRASATGRADDFGDIARRFNELAARLQDEQRGLQESLQLLSKTLAALDGAVFAFERDGRLRLVNPAGERLLGRPAHELLGTDAMTLGLAPFFDVPSGEIVPHVFASQTGRWQVGHAALRSRSQEGRLLVVQPMERALRDEEALAFRRLLRVLSHEITNSMAPIGSLVETLKGVLPAAGKPVDDDLHDDLRHGLEVIGQRSAALQRFVGQYARLARLPPPQPALMDIPPFCEQVVRLFDDVRIRITPGEALQCHGDRDQLEQVLINLLRNAVEAGGDHDVLLGWRRVDARVLVEVTDCGPGLPASGNLFVPFFTTKTHGAGIGLALSRQIVEAQGGTLELHGRDGAQGAVARLSLPLAKAG